MFVHTAHTARFSTTAARDRSDSTEYAPTPCIVPRENVSGHTCRAVCTDHVGAVVMPTPSTKADDGPYTPPDVMPTRDVENTCVGTVATVYMHSVCALPESSSVPLK